MQSQLTVRLPAELDLAITGYARKLHLKRSDIIRMALEKFVEEFKGEAPARPYENVKKLLGIFASGIPDLGQNHRAYIMKRIRNRA